MAQKLNGLDRILRPTQYYNTIKEYTGANSIGKPFFLPPSILGRICFFSLYNKIVRPASSDSQNRSHNLPEWFDGEVAAIFLFFLLFFILTKSLNNHSKSQKIKKEKI